LLSFYYFKFECSIGRVHECDFVF